MSRRKMTEEEAAAIVSATMRAALGADPSFPQPPAPGDRSAVTDAWAGLVGAAWTTISEIVLEEAAKACEAEGLARPSIDAPSFAKAANLIRALKGDAG